MAAVALALAVAGPAFAAEPCREAQADRCELFDGVSYRRIVRSAPTARVTHVVEIDLTRPGLRLALTPGDSSRGLEYIARTTSEQLDRSGALVAVNASYFLPFFGGTPGNNDFFPQAGDPSDVSGASLAGGYRSRRSTPPRISASIRSHASLPESSRSMPGSPARQDSPMAWRRDRACWLPARGFAPPSLRPWPVRPSRRP